MMWALLFFPFNLANVGLILINATHSSQRVDSFIVAGSTLFLTHLEREKDHHGALKSFQLYTNDSSNKFDDVFLPQPFDKLISPTNLQLDECYRLWVLDRGDLISSPTLQAFHLKHNRTEIIYTLPPDSFNSLSLSFDFAVDIGKTCADTWAHVAFFEDGKFLILSNEMHKKEVLRHEFYFPENGNFLPSYNNDPSVDSFGIAILGPKLILHSSSSKRDFSIHTEVLKSAGFQDESGATLHLEPSCGGNMKLDKNTSVLFFVKSRKICCRASNHSILSESFENFEIGLKNGEIVDFQIVGPNLWLLIQNEQTFIIEIMEIEKLIAGTSCHNK